MVVNFYEHNPSSWAIFHMLSTQIVLSFCSACINFQLCPTVHSRRIHGYFIHVQYYPLVAKYLTALFCEWYDWFLTL